MLKNKICLITGCSKGIGAATVEKFAKEHATIYASARTEGCIDRSCEELSEAYQTQVMPLYFDVTDEAASKQAIMKIKKEQGRLDVLVNNAGIMQDALIGMVSKKLMQNIFDVNVFAVMNMIQLANKLMSRQRSGSIINISSIVGVEGNAGQLVYSASKGAVAALTKTAAKELAVHHIRVNAIAPGMIDTDMFRSIGEEKIQEHLKNIRLGRLGTPEDVANAIAFLASDDAEYITGQILGVDGEVSI
jgi:3-oxoacyl-[acyl-carrier protein] reductase